MAAGPREPDEGGMQMRRVTIALLVGIASCTPIGGLASGAGDAAAPTDSGVADAGSGDATARDDAGVCESAHVFCSNFDIGDVVVDGAKQTFVGWVFSTDDVGTVGPVTNRFVSKPRSVRATLPAVGGGFYKQAFMTRGITMSWRPTRVEFDMYVKRPAWSPTDGNVTIFALGFSPDIALTYFLKEGGGDLTLKLGTNTATPPNNITLYTGATAPEFDRWVHVRIDAVPNPTNGSFSVLFDGMSAAFKSGLTFDMRNAMTPGANVYAELGMRRYNNGPTPAFEIYYDNVTLDFP